MDWNLLARAQGALVVARKHLLGGYEEPLDEHAERFLGQHVDVLELRDVLAWMARRGRDEVELASGVIPTSDLAACFVDRWREEDGFNVHPSGGGYTLWWVEVRRINPHAWAQIVEAIAPRLPPITDPIARGARWYALRSLEGCDIFNRVADWKLPERVPIELREYAMTATYDVVETLLPVRWDLRACVAKLVGRAQAATTGAPDLYPLWLLDHLRLLADVSDPTTVLSAEVRLPVEYWLMTDAERSLRPSCHYPIRLALRWPGSGGELARRWVRSLIVGALERLGSAHVVEQAILGPDGFLPGRHWEDPEVTPLLTEWLGDEAEFDALMRLTVELGRPLPSAWVTVVRDLAQQRVGAWQNATSWIRAVALNAEACGSKVFDSLLRHAPVRAQSDAGGVAGTGVTNPSGALWWIVCAGPLPAEVDAAFEEALEAAFDSVERLASPWHSLLQSWSELRRWLRWTELPQTPARRASLVSALKAHPDWLAEEGIDDALGRIRPLALSELPPFEEVPWHRYPDLSGADAVRDRYLRLGGEHGTEAALRAFDAVLDREPLYPSVLAMWVWLVEPVLDSERRRVLGERLSRWSLSDLGVCIGGGRPLWTFVDLAKIARRQVGEPLGRFHELPRLSGMNEVLLTRLTWLIDEGDAAWEEVAADRQTAPHAHDEELDRDRSRAMVDEEVIVLVERMLGDGVDWQTLEGFVRARALLGSAERCEALVALLARQGASRRALIDLLIERLGRLSESGLVARTNPLVALAARVSTRAAWESEGAHLVSVFWETNVHLLVDVCRMALDRSDDCDNVTTAMQMTFAREITDRVRGAMERGDQRAARRGLLALMELDAPSRAIQMVLPLRKTPGQSEEVRTALEACIHLLRRDADRRPYLSTITSAVARWFSDADDPTDLAVTLLTP